MAEELLLKNNPVWYNAQKPEDYYRLNENLSFDAAVIGGGFTGVLTAYLLKKKGLKVALLEAERLGHGTTGHTTAHLTQITDTNFNTLAKHYNNNELTLLNRSQGEAIDLIEALIREHNIECDFRRLPAYFFTEHPSRTEELKSEAENARKGGLNPEFLNSIPLPFPVHAVVKYPGQAHFHTLKFIYKLAELFHGDGCYIFEKSRVLDVEESNPYKVITKEGSVSAKYVIYATHTPINIHVVQMEMKAGRSYILGAKIKDKGVEDALYWDNEDPYHYFNLFDTEEGRILMIGGGDHHQGSKESETEKLKELYDWAMERFNITSIPYVWSGQEYIPPDGLPYIGLSPFSSHKYVATGYSGNGLAFGAAAAMIITDLITEGKSSYEKLYSPSRIRLSGIPDILELNIHVAKHIIKDRIDNSLVEPLQGIKPGEGRIVEIDGEKTALYSDHDGTMYQLSPVCPHAKCMVNWNDYEKTWDCPCHGSRFYPTGEVLEGPAVKPLKIIK